MPLHSVSVETFPIPTDYSSNGRLRPSVPQRSTSYDCLVRDKSYKSVDLSQPYRAAFPSPPSSEDFTPCAQASKAKDSFPFPFQPATLKPKKTKEDEFSTPSYAKRRPFSAAQTYHTPPASPDRYIPARHTKDDHIKSYHLGKSPEQLSSSEKLLRHNSASPDPFSARSPQRVTDNTRPQPRSLSRDPASVRQRVVSDVLALPSGVIDQQPRRASAGAVWNVGGTVQALGSEPVIGIPNGRGGLFGSGTNAPMFTSKFFEKETSDQSRERFEGRIAAALEIDQTSRTLSIFRSPESTKDTDCSGAGPRRKRPVQTVWRDGQWVNDGSPTRKFTAVPGLHSSYAFSGFAIIESRH